MTIATLCNNAMAAGITVQKLSASALTRREKELLRSAGDDGIFHLSYNDVDGKHVDTNKQSFTNDDDPAETAHYLDAFTRLCSRGLVEHQDGELFRLTGQGFDIARKLAK